MIILTTGFIHLSIYRLFVFYFFSHVCISCPKTFPWKKRWRKVRRRQQQERTSALVEPPVGARVGLQGLWSRLWSRRLSWREWGYLGTPLHHWWPAHLPTCPPSSAVTCPASDIRHSGVGCASAKNIWVGTLWILTILTNNGYLNELINWLFVNHIVFIFKKKESIKMWKMGKVQWAMIAHYWTMLGHLGACGGLILLKLLLMQKTAKAFQG